MSAFFMEIQLFCFFKMLIVYTPLPISSPLKAFLFKLLNTQIIGADLIDKILFSIHVRHTGFGTDKRSFIGFIASARQLLN